MIDSTAGESCAGNPRVSTPRTWIIDGVVAVIGGLQGIGPTMTSTVPHWIGFTTTALSGIALLGRRKAPFPVFLATYVLAVGGGLIDSHLASHIAVLIALFTVADFGTRRQAAIATVLTEVAVLVQCTSIDIVAWWLSATLLTGLVAAAVGLGLFKSTRQAYVAELHDRNARLLRERDQLKELAAATERSRIAREMHDIVAHNLAVMIALSDGAIATVSGSPERAAEAMRAVSSTGRQALADTRRLLGVLRSGPESDDDRQPVPDLSQLDDLIGRVRAAGLPVTYEVTGAPPNELPAGVQLTVFRLVQEALTNTLKHGGPAVRSTVRLDYLDDEVQVEVSDDGRGLVSVSSGAVSSGSGPGAGLIGMRERVETFGGRLETGPGRAGGWRVAARLKAGEPA